MIKANVSTRHFGTGLGETDKIKYDNIFNKIPQKQYCSL